MGRGQGPSPPPAHTQRGLWALSPQSLPWPGPRLQHGPLLGQEGSLRGLAERLHGLSASDGQHRRGERPGCPWPAGGGEACPEWGTHAGPGRVLP